MGRLELELLTRAGPLVPALQNEVMLDLLVVGAPIPGIVVMRSHRVPAVRFACLMAMNSHLRSSVAGQGTCLLPDIARASYSTKCA